MTIRLQHEWTPEHLAAAVAEWRRLLDLYNASAYEVVGSCGTRRYVASKNVTDEWITALVISDGEPVEFPADPSGYRPSYPAVEIALISYSDYGGNSYDAANVRALAGVPGVTTSTDGRQGAGSATVLVGEMPQEEAGIAESVARIRYIADVMESLESDGGPLIDDEAHDEYVDELAEAAWDQWLRLDVQGELWEAFGDDDDAQDAVEAADNDAIREAFYGYRHPSGEGWQAEGATSVIHVHRKAAVRHVLVKVFGRTDVENDCETCQYGQH